jgi:hypothetical protein
MTSFSDDQPVVSLKRSALHRELCVPVTEAS